MAGLRLGGDRGRWTRPRRPPSGVPRARGGADAAALRHRSHHQGPRRLLHGEPGTLAPRRDEPGAIRDGDVGTQGMSAVEAKSATEFDCRGAFAAALESLAEADPRIVTVVNDSLGSSKLTGFKKRFPER